MNHFFAVKLPEEATQVIKKSVDEWRPQVMTASWYDPEDYHITLKFLGNLDEAEQPRLIKAAKPVAEETSPLNIRAASFGGFPSMRDPSVLWAGVSLSAELEALSAHLDQAMTVIGFRGDRRRYHPHITVARCRLRTTRFSNGQAKLVPEDWPLPSEHLFPPFVADEFFLMQTLPPGSRTKDLKARYNLVHTFPFGNKQVSDVS